MIKAPYNFAPLNEKVFYPSWAKEISHDIPFKDGESGELELSITAHSPIFIANSKKDREEKETRFCNIDGKFFIPATSIKGTIRSVLEIISFSKLRDFDDSTYAVRDFSDAKNFYMKQMREPTYCGWLYKKDDDFFIQDCGIPGRISQKEIDKIYNIEFSKIFRDGEFDDKDKEKKVAKYKYSLLKGKDLENKFSYLKKSNLRDVYIQDNSGKAGTIVFTGQSSARKEAPNPKDSSGKIYEFIFFNEIKQEILVSQKMMEDFKFAYFDDRKTEPKESIDWAYWKAKLKNDGKVPVFFQLDDKGELLHFGLAYMYKIIYKHSISAGILQNTKNSLDLTQAIFGYTDKDTKEALKGRVYFSHFLALGSPKELDLRGEILGTPRASYYPNYIKQSDGVKLKSYMDDRFEIAGRKRYPVHKGSEVSTTKEEKELQNSENVKSFFSPLDKGTKFSGKVKFHNLKKAEIGALISAITFHNTKNTFHNLGFAKPYGYGKCTIEITNLSQDEIREYLVAFEKEILKQIPYWGDLKQNSSLRELLAMAMEQESKGDFTLEYMKLKGFATAKTEGKSLKPYSSLVDFDDSCFKLSLSKEELENLEILKKWQSIQNTQDINILKSFIQNYPDSDFTKEAKEKLEQINRQIKQKAEQEEDKKAWDNWAYVSESRQNRYYKEMIEKHIKTYPDHDSVDEAKKELERLSLESKEEPNESANAMDIIKLSNLDEITRLLKKLDKSKIDISDEKRSKIASHIKNLAKDASKKRVRTFRRKAELQKIFKESQIDEIFKKFE
ncbi:MAG: TIGR03986 family CRISPR-associated RAMP protein [Campylobacter sp.]|nr:TIGR03986 family CRISPR-associated RAMP protein [Campylobacter sp.]